jgi:hypothetical protein
MALHGVKVMRIIIIIIYPVATLRLPGWYDRQKVKNICKNWKQLFPCKFSMWTILYSALSNSSHKDIYIKKSGKDSTL